MYATQPGYHKVVKIIKFPVFNPLHYYSLENGTVVPHCSLIINI